MITTRELTKVYGGKTCVDAVSFEIRPGETAAIVGRSGSGKSTLARLCARLERPTAGRVLFDGRDITDLPAKELVPIRRRLQIVFQDPGTALDPRMTIQAVLEEPLQIHALDRPTPTELLELVGLPSALSSRFPHELSGGQKQRVAIARALSLSPELLILDEPTSALDRQTESELLALLERLKKDRALTYLIISHDLRTVRAFASRALVMHAGRIVEDQPADSLFACPEHPEAKALVMAARTIR